MGCCEACICDTSRTEDNPVLIKEGLWDIEPHDTALD